MSEDTMQGRSDADDIDRDDWDDDEDLSLVERVERLEEEIADIHLTEQEERDLTAAIEHLGANATSLAKALLDVDQNQKDLIRLRRRIKTIADTTAKRLDLFRLDYAIERTQAKVIKAGLPAAQNRAHSRLIRIGQ